MSGYYGYDDDEESFRISSIPSHAGAKFSICPKCKKHSMTEYRKVTEKPIGTGVNMSYSRLIRKCCICGHEADLFP